MVRSTVQAVLLALAVALAGFDGLAAVPKPEGGKAPPGTASALPPDTEIVAKVNGEGITAGQVRERMRTVDWRHSRRALGDAEARRLLLKEIAQDRLLVQFGRSSGIPGRREFKDRMAVVETLALGNAYYNKAIADYAPPEEAVRSLLPKAFRVVDFRIFFGATREDAEDARRQVLAGADMDNLVRSRSVGPGVENGGLVIGHRHGGIYFPPDIDALILSENAGWVSPIFENALGYNFARIERVIPFTAEDMEALTDQARQEAKREGVKRLLEEEWGKQTMTQDGKLLAELDALPIDSWGARRGEPVAEVGGVKIPVGEFLWFLKKAYPKDPAPAGKGVLPERLLQYQRYRVYAREARSRGMDRNREIEEGIRRAREELILAMVLDEIGGNAKVSGEDGKAYFSRHRNEWKRPEGRELRLIAVGSEEKAQEIEKALRSHPASFGSFARRYSLDRSGRNEGRIGTVTRAQVAQEAEDAVFSTAEGGIAGPFPVKGQYLLFLVERKVPAEPDPKYSDHAAEALEGARKEKKSDAIRAKKEELYRMAEVNVFTRVLEMVEWPSGGTPKGTH